MRRGGEKAQIWPSEHSSRTYVAAAAASRKGEKLIALHTIIVVLSVCVAFVSLLLKDGIRLSRNCVSIGKFAMVSMCVCVCV